MLLLKCLKGRGEAEESTIGIDRFVGLGKNTQYPFWEAGVSCTKAVTAGLHYPRLGLESVETCIQVSRPTENKNKVKLMGMLTKKLGSFIAKYNSLPDAEPIVQKIFAERVDLLFRNGFASSLVVVIASLMLFNIIVEVVSRPMSIAWLVTMLCAVVARISLIAWYIQSPQANTPYLWAKLYAVATGIMGMAWAWFTAISFGHNEWLNMLALMITLGITSLAVPVLVSFPFIMSLYYVPSTLTATVLCLAKMESNYSILGLILIIYALLIKRAANNFFCTLITSLHLRFEKEALATGLNQQKHNIEQLNMQLGQEIQQRRTAQQALEHHQQDLETQIEQRTAELREAKEAAEAGSRTKSEFLASISHEIRTPMNGVLGATQILLVAPMEPQQRHYVQIAHDSATHLLHLIDDILDFSRIESGQLTLAIDDFDLVEVCQHALSTIEPALRNKGLALSFMPPADLPTKLKGDALRLRQILLNLLSNAVKFTEHGQIALELEASQSAGGACCIRFSVRDSGIGIDAAALGKIFNAFTQEDGSITRRFGGSGLGLSITRSLVEAMGGTISVTSSKGIGSAFQCELPFGVPEQNEPQAKPIDLLPGNEAQMVFSGRILLAEDNEINQLIARAHLEALGFTVDTADNGIQARDARTRTDYRLILMDCHMPEMDGFDATLAIRQDEQACSLPRIPIIALTADAQQETRERCMVVGMDDYVSKPFSIDLLAEKISNALQPQSGILSLSI